MSASAIIIIVHQIIFQGVFFAKNLMLRRKLKIPIRGRNREANLSIALFSLFIIASVLLALYDIRFARVDLIARNTALVIALPLLAVNLFAAFASIIGLGNSWRVGVPENQQTELIEGGIYRFSRNPFFLSYIIMFAAYTILLESILLLILSLAGCVMIHAMILKEEKHLAALHGDRYRRYRERVPRYIII